MMPAYDFDKLEKLLNSLYLITDHKITLKSCDFNDVITSNSATEFCRLIQSTAYGHEKCIACNTRALIHARHRNGAYLYRCHAGLVDAAIPVTAGGRLLAYLMYGQVLDESPLDDQWMYIERQCSWYSDLYALRDAFDRLNHLDQKILWAYADILSACASYIGLQEYVKQTELSEAQLLASYSEENYAKELTLGIISTELGIGKTKLCETARKNFDCSIQQLIRQRRVEAAKALMTTGNMSIREIAEAVGISDSNYFVKVFKGATGYTPLRYKRMIQKSAGSAQLMPPELT